MKQQMSCLLQTSRRMQQMVSLCWACAQSLWLSSCSVISIQNKNICFHHLEAEEKQKCSNSHPRARLLFRSSGHFPDNYIQSGPFSSQLKGFAIGEKNAEENLLVFCNVLEHRIWINEWKLAWPQPRKEATEITAKRSLIVKNGRKGIFPHHTIYQTNFLMRYI